ncbi:MAG: iron-sulfur cluster assembly scaffold protein [Rhodospirillales bacterium]
MTDDLYQAAIMDRAGRAARDRPLVDADGRATADNPLCGDRVTIEVRLDGDRIAALGYRVRGCALCRASTATISESVIGITAAEVAVGEAVLGAVLAGSVPTASDRWAALAMFRPVRDHRSRHSCVRLPFDALAEAIRRGRASTP